MAEARVVAYDSGKSQLLLTSSEVGKLHGIRIALTKTADLKFSHMLSESDARVLTEKINLKDFDGSSTTNAQWKATQFPH
ncbi:hypothetical protein C5167_030689 [Papaver somniferum]|nr:hypothetical protein C5167_030689 [Papaver somniferum]